MGPFLFLDFTFAVSNEEDSTFCNCRKVQKHLKGQYFPLKNKPPFTGF